MNSSSWLPSALFAASCALIGCNGTAQLGMADTAPTNEALGTVYADWRIPRLIEDVSSVCTFRDGPLKIADGDQLEPLALCGGPDNHAGTNAAVADVKKAVQDDQYRLVFGLLIAAIGADEHKKESDGDPKTNRMAVDMNASIDQSFSVPGLSVKVAGVTFSCTLEGTVQAKLDALTVDGLEAKWASNKGAAGLQTTLQTRDLRVSGSFEGSFSGCKAGAVSTPSILSSSVSFDFMAKAESVDASVTLWPKAKPMHRDLAMNVTADVDVDNASVSLKLGSLPGFAKDALTSGSAATAVRAAIGQRVDGALGSRIAASLTKAISPSARAQAAEMFEALIDEDQVFCNGATHSSSEGQPAARFRYDDAKPAVRNVCVDYN